MWTRWTSGGGERAYTLDRSDRMMNPSWEQREP